MCRSALLALIPVALLGCGAGIETFPTAKVSGKVLCDGQPLAEVKVYFAPVRTKGKLDSGKPGVGDADMDGIFTLSTYGEEDGAVIGKHNVSVSGPHPEEFPDFNCKCETDGNQVLQQVEVTADGENDFTITVPLKTAKSKPNISADDLEDIKQAELDAAQQEKAE